jgi:hypothetical protein
VTTAGTNQAGVFIIFSILPQGEKRKRTMSAPSLLALPNPAYHGYHASRI